MSQQINLFNPLFQKQKQRVGPVLIGQVLALLLVAAVLVQGIGKYRLSQLEQQVEAGQRLLTEQQQRLNDINARHSLRQSDPQLAAQTVRLQGQLDDLRGVDAILRDGRIGNTHGYAEHFRALARRNLNGVWLTGLTISGADDAIGVRGRAMQPALIPAYIAQLTAEKVMRGKTFVSLEIGRGTRSGEAGAASAAASVELAAQPYVDFSLQSTEREGGK